MIGGVDKNYREYKSQWLKIKDFVKGINSVKKNAIKNDYVVLPKGIYKNSPDAKKYIERGYLPEFTSTALNEANGRIFQQEPRIPENLELLNDFKSNVDLANVSLSEMTAKVVDNLNSVTRCGILVDWKGKEQRYKNIKELEDSGDRAFFRFYDCLDIAEVVTNSEGKIIKIELIETYIQDSQSFYKIGGNYEELEARRVLFINENGLYEHRLYVEEKDPKEAIKNSGWTMLKQSIPLANGKPFTEIPFVLFNGKTNNHEVYKPRLLDMTETMVAIYRNWIELEHIMHGVCLPIRTATGVTQDEVSNLAKVGPLELWYSSNPEAKFGMLEYGGNAIQDVVKNIENKLNIAERIGYVFMTDAGNKTAKQTMIETTGRVLTLKDVIESTNSGITKALEYVFKFHRLPFNPEKNDLELSIKQDDEQIDSNVFRALIEACQINLMRYKDMHKYQVEHKLTDEQDFEIWKREVSEQVPETNIDSGGSNFNIEED